MENHNLQNGFIFRSTKNYLTLCILLHSDILKKENLREFSSEVFFARLYYAFICNHDQILLNQ